MAESKTVIVEKKIETIVKEKHIELTLTEEEAQVLQDILNRIGGSPDGVRGLADNIGKALTLQGVLSPGYETEDGYSAIYFVD